MVPADTPKESPLPPAQNPASASSAPTPPPTTADKAPALTPEEQMEKFAEELKEQDWGHQPC